MSQATSMPLQYKRLYNGLLDADGVHPSLESAKAYAAGPTGCPGHIIGVLVDGVRRAYIVEEDGTLSRMATAAEVESSAPVWDTIE